MLRPWAIRCPPGLRRAERPFGSAATIAASSACGLTQVVVDHGEGGHLSPPLHLLGALFDPLADVLLVVSPGRQAGRLHLGRGGQEEDDRGVGTLGQDLLGSLHVDLEEDVGSLGRLREWAFP